MVQQFSPSHHSKVALPTNLNQHSSVFGSSTGAIAFNDSPSTLLQRNNYEDIQMGEFSGGVAASDINSSVIAVG